MKDQPRQIRLRPRTRRAERDYTKTRWHALATAVAPFLSLTVLGYLAFLGYQLQAQRETDRQIELDRQVDLVALRTLIEAELLVSDALLAMHDEAFAVEKGIPLSIRLGGMAEAVRTQRYRDEKVRVNRVGIFSWSLVEELNDEYPLRSVSSSIERSPRDQDRHSPLGFINPILFSLEEAVFLASDIVRVRRIALLEDKKMFALSDNGERLEVAGHFDITSFSSIVLLDEWGRATSRDGRVSRRGQSVATNNLNETAERLWTRLIIPPREEFRIPGKNSNAELTMQVHPSQPELFLQSLLLRIVELQQDVLRTNPSTAIAYAEMRASLDEAQVQRRQ